MLKILQTPHAVLSQKAKPVDKVDTKIIRFVAEMEEAMDNAKDPEGVGLAANQVGKAIAIFVIRQSPRSPLLTFINPKIEEHAQVHPKPIRDEEDVQLEGCLSLKDIWGVVDREDALILSYQDISGIHHKKKFTGFLATIIQHEMDHLDGILFPQRVLSQKNKLYKSNRDKNGEQVFEEINL